MVKAVIFDCFGVLVGTGFWNVYSRLGGDIEKDTKFIDDVVNKASTDRMTRDEFRNTVAKHLGITRQQYDATFEADEVPNPSVFDFIRRELKPTYKIGLLSNAMSGTMQRKIPPELLELFDTVIVSGEVGLLKPDPAIFRLTAERLGVKPEEAVYTDDHAEYLPGAQAAGMQTILYKNFEDFKQQLNQLLRSRP